jgi:hypothetical protein
MWSVLLTSPPHVPPPLSPLVPPLAIAHTHRVHLPFWLPTPPPAGADRHLRPSPHCLCPQGALLCSRGELQVCSHLSPGPAGHSGAGPALPVVCALPTRRGRAEDDTGTSMVPHTHAPALPVPRPPRDARGARQASIPPVSCARSLAAAWQIDDPGVDFTPPHLISSVMTDLGVFTPSAVSDELIKLYA